MNFRRATGYCFNVALDAACFCNPVSGTDTGYPVTEVGDLVAEFTPPFHLVTVSSLQTTSVPMQIGWLLGGLLLGLGMKRALGR